MLAGSVLTGIATGIAGMMVSVAFGHPAALSLMFYGLSGCCGMMAFALLSVRMHDV